MHPAPARLIEMLTNCFASSMQQSNDRTKRGWCCDTTIYEASHLSGSNMSSGAQRHLARPSPCPKCKLSERTQPPPPTSSCLLLASASPTKSRNVYFSQSGPLSILDNMHNHFSRRVLVGCQLINAVTRRVLMRYACIRGDHHGSYMTYFKYTKPSCRFTS
jgi:hypothetical protein